MAHRPDLNAVSPADRTTLVNLMLTYINDAVVWSHNPNNPNAIVHHMGEHAFTTHRILSEIWSRGFLRMAADSSFPCQSGIPPIQSLQSLTL